MEGRTAKSLQCILESTFLGELARVQVWAMALRSRNLRLCHDLSIRGGNFSTGFITLQILLLPELELFHPLAKPE